MCLGNRAENSAQYINSQLQVQWQNSQRCAEKHGTGLKPTDAVVETGTCLFEFYGPGKHGRYQPSREDLLFYTSFGAPRVEFVCNHEVILFLELLEGHFNFEPSKRSTNHEFREPIKNITLAYRLNFSSHSLDNFACGAIGNSDKYTVKLLVLDVASAGLVTELSSFSDISILHNEKNFYTRDQKITTLSQYILRHYLPLFKRGGFHVLYSLPDFDSLSATTVHVDYSIISKRSLSIDRLYDFEISTINDYLRSLWLQCATYIDEFGVGHDDVTIGKHLLAEHNTRWTRNVEDIHLRMFFGPLSVQALCKREVILFIDLQDFEVHFGGDFSYAAHTYSGWKLAFIVDVAYEQSPHLKRIKLDFSTARFCEHLSVIPDTAVEFEYFTSVRVTLVRYILEVYFALIVTYSFHVICEIGPEPLLTDIETDTDEEFGCDCRDTCTHTGICWGTLPSRMITHTDMCGFDVITAVTQGSINLHLKHAYDSARQRCTTLGSTHTWSSAEIEMGTCMAGWTYVHKDHGDEAFFNASFDAPRLQLLCSEGSQKAILYLTIREGHLRVLGPNRSLLPGSDLHTFTRWRLAFEVELKLVDATEISLSEIILKRLDREHHRTFKQLVIDFSSARLNLKHSSFPGLLEGDDYRKIRSRREALIHYISEHYFATLMRGRFHVLYTIPLFDDDGKGNQLHTITSLKFQILPFCYRENAACIDGLFGRQKVIYDRNSIVFLGMIDGRQLPLGHLPYGINWVFGSRTEHPQGTVCISRRAFLESRVLKLLEEINRKTTIVPQFSGVQNGKWYLQLTTWGEHTLKRRDRCHWSQLPSSAESLNFEWKNRDDWRYEHDCESDGSGLYSVKCSTHNKVSVPTSRRRGGCSILISGDVTLSLDYVGGSKEWSAGMTVHWSAAITFHTDIIHGLKISVSPTKIVPDFQKIKVRGELGKSIYEETFAHLREQFPSVIDFNHVLLELCEAFEGCWTGLHTFSRELDVANPVFNKHGDLILDLGLHVQSILDIPGLPRSITTNGSQTSVLHVGTKVKEIVSESTSIPKVIAKAVVQNGTRHTEITKLTSTNVSIESNGEVSLTMTGEEL